MRTHALILAFLLPLAGCGQPGAPLLARAVCAVERWLSQDDYRRREPGSGLCDAQGLRIPRPDLGEDDAEPSAEPSAREGDP